MNVFAGAANGLRNESDTVNDVVVLDFGDGAVFTSDGNGLVADVADAGVQVGRDLLVGQHVTQEGSVCKADVLCGNKVSSVFNNDRVFALEDHFICSFAGGLTAAEEDNFVTYGNFLTQQLSEGQALLESGDSHLSRSCTSCNNDVVESTQYAKVVDLGVEAELDAGFLYFSLVPLNELLVVLFEGHCGSSQEQTTDLIGLLEDYRVVAALFQNQSSFTSADTSADNGNFLRAVGRNDFISVVLHGGRVQCATAQMQGVFQRLDVCGASVLSKVEATIVAADAGTDVLFSAFLDLDDPLGIDEVLTCDGNCVQTTSCDFFSCFFRSHTASAGNRHVGELLDVLNIFQVAVIRHVLRRMCPVPSIVGTVVAVEELISANFFQMFDCLLGFGQITEELFEFSPGTAPWHQPLV